MERLHQTSFTHTGAVKRATMAAVKKTGIDAKTTTARTAGGMKGLAFFMYGTRG